MERRTLVRLLVVLAIGVPILVEAGTFLGLVDMRLFGGGAEEATPTPAPEPAGVGVGDELLPATTQSETVTAARVERIDGERTFVLAVAVENRGSEGYELRLDALTTDGGTTVTGGGRSEQLPPGANATVTGRWTLPPGESPRSVIVVATVTGEDGERETVTRRVDLAVG